MAICFWAWLKTVNSIGYLRFVNRGAKKEVLPVPASLHAAQCTKSPTQNAAGQSNAVLHAGLGGNWPKLEVIPRRSSISQCKMGLTSRQEGRQHPEVYVPSRNGCLATLACLAYASRLLCLVSARCSAKPRRRLSARHCACLTAVPVAI